MGIDPNHERKRQSLRGVGLFLVALGAILLLVGLIDFFASWDSFEPPKLFWMAMLGMVLLGIGLKVAGAGFLGAITRYGAAEVAPVAKDALEYLRDPAHSADELVVCPKCGTHARPDARFCDSCGKSLGQTT